MKKILSIILILSLAFSLTACKKAVDEEDVRGEQIDYNEEQNEEVEENEVEEDVEEVKEELSLGQTNGISYENKFIGIGCALEEGWTFCSDEEIRALNNYVGEAAGEEYLEAMKSADIIYDMFAQSESGLSNVNVNLEKVDPLLLKQVELEAYFQSLISDVKSTFENMGYTDIEFEITTVKVGGEDVLCLRIQGVIDGIEMHQKVISIKCDGYLANITVTTYGEDAVDSVFDDFYFVN